MFESKSLEGYKKTKKDDLVINTMWAWKGAAGIAPQNGLVSPSYHVYRPNDRMLPEFADILYRSPAYASEMDRFSEGVWKSRNRLYPDVFLRMDTVLPPKEEQQRIVDELVKKHSTIDRLDGLIDDSIELLEEKKQSIITKVITGQTHVRSPKEGSLEVEL
jgi:type I restriction enzyme S subunit